MKRRENQRSLLDVWSQRSCEKRRKDTTSTDTTSFESIGDDSAELSEDESLADESTDISEDQTSRLDLDLPQSTGAAIKSCMCCNDDQRAYHPHEGTVLSLFTRKGRRFLPTWYDKFPWITLCTAQKKVFCVYCRYAYKHDLFTFCKKGDEAFSVKGFDNYKKAVEKFRIHENSDSHLEGRLKCRSLNNPSIQEQLSCQAAKIQETRRLGIVKQLEAMKFLLRQGIALRGHLEEEGNLRQLLIMWSKDNAVIKSWIEEGKYMSHDIVNELITLMGQSVLRKLLCRIKNSDPCSFAIIVDETADVAQRKQLNLTIRYVNDDYIIIINEDFIGLFSLPNTTAATLHVVVKDLLLRCNLPLPLCRGQAYDGASAMQGKRRGLATLIKNEVPAALPVHCLAHLLNLCLQDVARQVELLRDAINVVREIIGLIEYSPKRAHLFNEKLLQSDGPKCGIKPLCPTRWTVRTEAMDAVIKQYSVLMETMEEVHHTTRDEYGLKAAGYLLHLKSLRHSLA